mmetsp:Transcript_35713/g.83604  ORF Transcript_35713/g.83604 Transcript_35713/m.83604 type:complete len:409 (-) Transcript_35713:129-1355(-)
MSVTTQAFFDPTSSWSPLRVSPLPAPASHRASSSSRLQRAGHASLPLTPSYVTSSERRKMANLLQALQSRDADARRSAAEDLAFMANGPAIAEQLQPHTVAIVKRVHDKDPQVRAAVLGLLRKVAEKHEVRSISLHSADIATCLRDPEISIRRRSAALCRIIAEGGGAAALSLHVPRLIDCCEGENQLVTPFEALAALADAGEASAVARGLPSYLRNLETGSARIRVAACQTIIAIARSSGELGSALDLLERSGTNQSKISVVQLLLRLAREEPDREARLASAIVLRNIVQADSECEALFLQRARSSPVPLAELLDAEVRHLLQDVLPEEPEELQIFRSSRADSSDEEEDDSAGVVVSCVICHQRLGTRRTVEALQCGHAFHAACIRRWLSLSDRHGCPLCRVAPLLP